MEHEVNNLDSQAAYDFDRPSFTVRTLLVVGALLSGATLLALSGCSDAQSEVQAAPPPPAVSVATAVSQPVTDWSEYTGRFEAVDRVELRPRVSGYIDDVLFMEGHEVQKGELLFQIDPRPYRVALARAQADLARVKAQAQLAEAESQRAKRLLDARAISQEEHDRRISQSTQAGADLAAAQAAVAAAQLDLDYTRVTAPIAGRVSRAVVTAGNYVNAGQTVLTSVVSLDPIYVSFDGDEYSYLKQTDAAQRGATPVRVGLANEEGYPHEGRIDFIDNALDPATGTIRTRAVLANPDRRFAPGLFARVRLPGSGQYQATVVPDTAIGTDQNRRFVLVVNTDNVVEYRAVELGGAQDALRIVRTGLKPGERIVVSGLQRARPGTKVAPQQAPALTAAADAAPRS